MIPKLAVQEFLAKPRDDLRQYKKLSADDLEDIKRKFPVVPPIWDVLRHHQKVALVLGIKHRRMSMWLDTGCVAADTMIETDNGPIRIDQLYQQGKPIRVWSLTATGLRIVDASCPFQRGPTALYEVRFTSGRTITVTANHRFLTERGWVDCASVLADEHFPVFYACHPSSTSELCLSACQPNDLHWNRRQTDCSDHCYRDYCRGGEQPLSWLEIDLAFSPLPTVIPTHTYVLSHEDGQVSRCTNSPSLLSDHPSTHHYENPLTLYSNCTEYLDDGFPSGLLGDVDLHNDLTIREDASQEKQGIATSATSGAYVDTLPSAYCPPFDTIASITYKGHNVYYDMHVPTHENYIAHGLCHHNTGKTLLSIALARYLRRAKLLKRVLVLVPNNINRYEWLREIKKHSPKTSCIVLAGSSAHKWERLRGSDAFLVVATYAGLSRMVSELVSKSEDKNELIPVKELVAEVASTFDGLVMDESTSIGNHRTVAFRICKQLSSTANAVWNLSGTPFGRDPTPLWAQMYLIDRGESLGKNLGIFRAAFFKEKENYWSGYPDYEFDNRKTEQLNRLLAHRSIRYEADKADLPQVVSIVKEVQLPADARTYYQQAKQKIIDARGNVPIIQNAFLRMRQISSGFLGYKDDTLGIKSEFEFTPNPKLEMLLSIIEAAYQSSKIVVMHDFIFSGMMISRELKRMKIGHVSLSGRTKKSDAPELLRRFDEDPDCRVFVINAAGAFGLNLQIAKLQVFYESPPSPILRKQMERRVERQESDHSKIFRYDLVTRGTVDAQILSYHQQGKDLFEAIVSGKATL